MTSLVVEFIRPNGNLLRVIDAGFEFIDTSGTPLSNAERPIRIETDAVGLSALIPLPDGLKTGIQIAGKDLRMDQKPLVVKGRVVLDGVCYELNVCVTAQLKAIETHVEPAVAPIASVRASITQNAHLSPAIKGPPSLKCPRPDCRGNLKLVRWRIGAGVNEFLGCSEYPRCDYKRSLK